MSTREIERRLTAVEQEIAPLKDERRPAAETHLVRALEKLHGTFENDEAFREAAARPELAEVSGPSWP